MTLQCVAEGEASCTVSCQSYRTGGVECRPARYPCKPPMKGHNMPDSTADPIRPHRPPLTEAHAAELVAERLKVAAGPYGPEHDRAHGLAHLAQLTTDRLEGFGPWARRDTDPVTAEDRKLWVQVGQFALAALELIDTQAVDQ